MAINKNGNQTEKEETLNLSKVSRFLFKSFYIGKLQKHCFFSHTNPYILNEGLNGVVAFTVIG